MKFNWRLCRRSIASALAAAILLVACGGGGGGGEVVPVAPGTISLLAGALRIASGQDGVGVAAKFVYPFGIAQDAAGNIYVVDGGDNTIRKIAPDRTVTTLAGMPGQFGTADGIGSAARFNWPAALAVDAHGNVFVADTGNQTIRKISPDGTVTTVAGGQGGAMHGTGANAQFFSPRALAFDPAGNLFVVDDSGALRKVSPDGTVTIFAGKLNVHEYAVGDGDQARFNILTGVAVDGDGVVYVSEFATRPGGDTGRVRRFDSQARALPWGDAPQGVINVPYPSAITVGAGGDLIVASTAAKDIYEGQNYNEIWRITSAGTTVRVAGQEGLSGRGSTDGAGPVARFFAPSGLAFGPDGRILVADWGNSAIRQIDAQGIVSTIAGGPRIGRLDGPGVSARFFDPSAIAAAPDGNLYVADRMNAQIRRVSLSGNVSTLTMTAGGKSFDTLDGPVDTLSASPDGTLYVSFGNGVLAAIDSSGRYRQVGTIFSLLRMAATPWGLYYTVRDPYGDDRVYRLLPDGSTQVISPALYHLFSIAVDAVGTVYVTAETTVIAIDPLGGIRRVAGRPNTPGHVDGNADDATFTYPGAIAVDDVGNLYVDDDSTIRKITPQGQVSTVAGSPYRRLAAVGPLPGAVGFDVSGLAWVRGMLYATVPDAVLAIGPIN